MEIHTKAISKIDRGTEKALTLTAMETDMKGTGSRTKVTATASTSGEMAGSSWVATRKEMPSLEQSGRQMEKKHLITTGTGSLKRPSEMQINNSFY